MKDLLQDALRQAQKLGASYADIRVTEQESEEIAVKSGVVDALSSSRDGGFGVRVIVNGAWGFASASMLTPEIITRTVRDAVNLARAAALTKQRDVTLAPAPVVV